MYRNRLIVRREVGSLGVWIAAFLLMGYVFSACADDPGTNHWAGSVSAGLGVAGGNTENLQVGLAAETHRKYPKDEWKFGAGLTYGETTEDVKNSSGVK